MAKLKAPEALPSHDGIREFAFPDSTRRISINRKYVAFIAETDEAGRTIIGFCTQARACPVDASYDDVYAWWRRKAIPQRREDRANAAPPNTSGGPKTPAPNETKSAIALSLPPSKRT